MANPTDQINETTDAINGANATVDKFQATILATSEVTDKFTVVANKLGLSMDQTSEHILKTKTVLSALGSTFSNVARNFDFVRSSNIYLFSDQVRDLSQLIDGLTPDAAQRKMKELASSMVSLGANQNQVNTALSQGPQKLLELASGFAKSADAGLKMQTAMFQLAGKTGNLEGIFSAVGDELAGMQQYLQQHSDLVTGVARASNISSEQAQHLYMALGEIPGALTANIKSSRDTSESYNVLNAALKLASGTGRETTDVIDDMKVAFKNYGLVGEDALKFSANMSQLNNKFGASFDIVRNSIRNASSELKMFGHAGEGAGKITESVSRIFNEYVGGLKASGLSADAATESVSGMISSIRHLTTAQKAYLSMQSGGPGGLRGALHIENLIRQGKMDEVMDMVTKQVTRLSGGKLATRDEAAQSDEAAARLYKQTSLLQMFGFGKGSPEEAHSIIEGLRKRQEGAPVAGLAEDFLQKSMERGTKVQETSTTPISQIVNELKATTLNVNIQNYSTMARVLGARTVSQQTDLDKLTEAEKNYKAGQRQAALIASHEGGARADKIARMHRGERVEDAPDVLDNIKRTAEAAKRAAQKQPIIDSGKALFLSNNEAKENEKREQDAMNKNIQESHRQRQARAQQLGRQMAEGVAGPSDVANQARRVVKSQDAKQAQQRDQNMQQGRVAQPKQEHDVNVTVTGFCLKCKRELDASPQAKAVDPTGGER